MRPSCSECTSERALDAWLDPAACPAEPPPLEAMGPSTRALHDALDAHARQSGVPYLHPDEPTVQQDLFGSARVISWQEGKAAFLFAAEGCWSELPPLYARYGTGPTGTLIARLKALEGAGAALVCDSGMQATALVFDTLMAPGCARGAVPADLQQDEVVHALAGRSARRHAHGGG